MSFFHLNRSMPTFCHGNFGKIDCILSSVFCVQTTPKKKLLSDCSGVSFTNKIFFDLHARWKCPFFSHILQVTSFARHTPMSWLGLFPHCEHLVCLDPPLPQPVVFKLVSLTSSPRQLEFALFICCLRKEKPVACELFPTARLLS